jgi:hypothetical protein
MMIPFREKCMPWRGILSRFHTLFIGGNPRGVNLPPFSISGGASTKALDILDDSHVKGALISSDDMEGRSPPFLR